MPGSHHRHGFTLIELLIVIAIIGILIAIMLPAVQSAREAARRSACQCHLTQLSLAFQLHHETHGHFPTGGWGHTFVGDADRGFGKDQPGGWVYNILPFLDEQPIRDLGKGAGPAEKSAAALELTQSPLALMNCPSRRRAALYPTSTTPAPRNAGLLSRPDAQAKSDYAANYGDGQDCREPGGNPTAHSRPCIVFHAAPFSILQVDKSGFRFWPNTDEVTGISFYRSLVRLADVTDGTSKTYAIGEKAVEPRFYEACCSLGDDWSMYSGQQDDQYRTTFHHPGNSATPVLDADEVPDGDVPLHQRFGSAHPAGCLMAFCDGSVALVSYDVDPEIHRRRGNRHDGAE